MNRLCKWDLQCLSAEKGIFPLLLEYPQLILDWEQSVRYQTSGIPKRQVPLLKLTASSRTLNMSSLGTSSYILDV